MRYKEILRFALFSFPTTYLLGVLARSLYYNPRPFVVGGFEPLIAHAPDNGFPSDHMLLFSAIAAAVFPYHRKTGVALWVLAFIVGAVRVFARVHHWLDIFASAIISILAAWVVYLFLKWRTNKPSLSPSQ